MKWFFIITTVLVCFIQNICALEDSKREEDFQNRWDYKRKYICYEFGFSNIFNICIFEGDSICDVYIVDTKGTKVLTSCPKTSILEWVFNLKPNELNNQLIEDSVYSPLYYKLSFKNDSSQIILSSSSASYNQPIAEENQIEELKVFLIQLWYSNCIKDNSTSVR